MLSTSEFKSLASFRVKKNLEKKLPSPYNSNSIALELLTQRYVDCFNASELPSQNYLLEYYFSENPDISMIAFSCEFYGGIYYDFLNSKKCPKNLTDIETGLTIAYSYLFNNFKGIKGLEKQTDSILASFRQTTDSITKENRTVITLHQ